MDGRISPSNVEDPRFTEPDAGPEIGWTSPDFGVQWPDVINALLEALPVVLERLRW